jgi:hypothetical protein
VEKQTILRKMSMTAIENVIPGGMIMGNFYDMEEISMDIIDST